MIRISKVNKRVDTKFYSAKVTMLALAGVGLIASACGSSSSSNASSNTTSAKNSSTSTTSSLGSAASYFKGKTITFIAPDAPGGTYDLYARVFAPALSQILGATVNVENVPGGGTVTGTDKMAAAAPDGLTIGDVNVPGDIGDVLQHNTALKVSLNSLSWIGQPATQVEVWVTPESSSINSFSQLVNSKNTITYGGSKSGVGWLVGATSMRAFNITTKFLTGYPDLVALSQGLISNEFQISENDLSGPYYSDIVGKKARPVMVTTTPSLPSLQAAVKGVPTVSEMITTAGLTGTDKAAMEEALSLGGFGMDFAGPPGMSTARLDVLRKAFLAAAALPSVKAACLKESLPLARTAGATLATEVQQAQSGASILAPFIQ